MLRPHERLSDFNNGQWLVGDEVNENHWLHFGYKSFGQYG